MAYCMLNHGHVPSCKMMLKGELKSKNIYWLSNWPYDKRELSCFNCPRSARKDPWRPAGESFEERALKAMNWDANKVTSRIFGIKNLKCQSMCLFFKFRQGFWRHNKYMLPFSFCHLDTTGSAFLGSHHSLRNEWDDCIWLPQLTPGSEVSKFEDEKIGNGNSLMWLITPGFTRSRIPKGQFPFGNHASMLALVEVCS